MLSGKEEQQAYAKGIQLNNVDIIYLGKEVRPVIIMDDVKDIKLSGVNIKPIPHVKSIVLKNAENFTIENSEGFTNKTWRKRVSISF